MSKKNYQKKIYNGSVCTSFFLQNKDKGKQYTVDDFKAEKISTATIRVIKRAETDSGYLRRVWSGRRALKMPNFKVNQLKSLFNNNDKVSFRQPASKFKISHAYVFKLIEKRQKLKKELKQRYHTEIGVNRTALDQCVVDFWENFQNTIGLLMTNPFLRPLTPASTAISFFTRVT
jgi:hypothetical protein